MNIQQGVNGLWIINKALTSQRVTRKEEWKYPFPVPSPNPVWRNATFTVEAKGYNTSSTEVIMVTCFLVTPTGSHPLSVSRPLIRMRDTH